MPPPPQPMYVRDVPTSYVVDGAGYLADPHALEYAVYDVSTEERRANPVQVYPVEGRAEAVRVSVGYFKAPYTPAGAELRGRRQVVWSCQYEEDGAWHTWHTEWEALSLPLPYASLPLYAMVCDARAEGITVRQATDARLLELLGRASTQLQKFTKRVFAPMPKVLTVAGADRSILQMEEPIVAVSRVETPERVYLPEEVMVYARHLYQRMETPDDRDNPKLELERSCFPRARKIHVTGVFGYTEPDGSPMGRTPLLIRHAALLLLRRELGPIGSPMRGSTMQDWRINSQRTRDQQVGYASPLSGTGRPGTPLFGAFTGDPEIDTIIAGFVRPPEMGAA